MTKEFLPNVFVAKHNMLTLRRANITFTNTQVIAITFANNANMRTQLARL